MTKLSDWYAQKKQATELAVQQYKDFDSQIKQEQIKSKEKIAELKSNMKALAKEIADNNKLLKERKLEPVQFTPVIKRIKKAGNTTPAPQST